MVFGLIQLSPLAESSNIDSLSDKFQLKQRNASQSLFIDGIEVNILDSLIIGEIFWLIAVLIQDYLCSFLRYLEFTYLIGDFGEVRG